MGELSGKKIFVVEDERDIAQFICINLELEGASTQHFSRGESVPDALIESCPNLILLDLMLPGLSGLDLCRWIRQYSQFKLLPIIMVTAKVSEENILQGLEMGADDYMTKPFSPKVLVAKVKTVLKRGERQVEKMDTISLHGIDICFGRHEVHVHGKKIQLRKVEFRILHSLMSRPGWVFTRNQLVDKIHGDNYAVTDRSIDFQMVGLRKKLGQAGQHIKTVHGVGYRFDDGASH